MRKDRLEILTSRRFLPLFVTQFLGAFNDNLFKNAMVILVTFRLAEAAGVSAQVMATLATGVFILPFFLFSATAGRLADRFEKQRLIALIKTAEILIMLLAAAAFSAGSIALLMTVLFLMGTHSTFFGPLKYGILPVHLTTDELLTGNALIEAGTFLAILLGTVAGGVLVMTEHGILAVSLLALAVALAGLGASLFIPRAPSAAPDLSIGFNIAAATWEMVRHAGGRREILLAILGISWFWLVGATFLAQFPAFAKDVLGGDDHVVTLFLTAFSIGIGIGSMLCNRLLKGEISARYVPAAALAMTLFIVDLNFASRRLAEGGGALLDISGFLAHPAAWRVLADLLLLSVGGGFYIVPLYALMQERSDPAHRARVIAANNILNALFMVAGALIAVALIKLGFSVPEIFLAFGLLNLLVALYICRLLPETVLKRLLAGLFRLAYGAELRGAENDAGERAVIVANHVSFLDAALIAAFLPDRPTFAVNTEIARRWWFRPALALVDAVPIDPTNPLAAKTLIKAVQAGRRCVIFPEGRITVTGALMKIYEGPGMIADKAGAAILPLRIDGAQYTPFSRLRGKVRLRWFPKITLTLLPPRRLEVEPSLRGRARRQAIGLELYDLMTDLVFETTNVRQTLFAALLEARRIHGGRRAVVEDIRRQPVSYNRLLAGSFALGRKLAAISEPGERVGLLLPNAAGAAVAFFALQAVGRVPALLNFTAGPAGMGAACRAAEIKLVVTSRAFLQMAKLEDAAERLRRERELRLVPLEDLAAGIGPRERLRAWWQSLWPGLFAPQRARPDDPAVVLFTSGSEGLPKGVALSHANILANRHQLGAVIDFNPTDVVLNVLPIFHSFGLTGGLLLPLLAGVKTFLYPSPLHYRIVPQLAYDSNATILFGTDTFLAGYARAAHAYDFYSLRYVFAGAERVRAETRRAWSEKFGLRLLEGYGATETAPVIAVNTPMQFKAGTVGRFLPGIRWRLEPVPGVAGGGRLILRGPNVMLGYLRVEAPGRIEPPADGAYDTGDIVSVDDRGFVTILGRAKRFAKIAGEMVSLAAVEGAAARLWPDRLHGVVAVPDPRKGEQLVLVTDEPGATREALLAAAREDGLPELSLPRAILHVERMPLLGSGKIDYAALADLAGQAAAAGPAVNQI